MCYLSISLLLSKTVHEVSVCVHVFFKRVEMI